MLGPALIATGYLLCLVVCVALAAGRRSRGVGPDPPTMDLGGEPPAVVNLLVHLDRVTVDAAEATLLDLAGRGVVELWSADGAGTNTLVYLRQPDPPGLRAYEDRVLSRVKERIAAGSVPLRALAFQKDADADRFLAAMHQEVLADATAHGLVGPRPGALRVPLAAALASLAANVAGLLAVLVGYHPGALSSDVWYALLFGFVLSLPLFGAYGRFASGGTARTPAGERRTAHWLGVRDWLRSFPSFADLPSEATAIWDRYVAYGAALDATPVASESVNLSYDYSVLWSRYTGQWRRVRLGGGPPTGCLPMVLVVVGCLIGGNLFIALAFGPSRLIGLAGGGVLDPHNPGRAALLGLLIAALAPAYLLIRYLVDGAMPVRCTGQVLRASAYDPNGTERAYVIDTGTTDVARTWVGRYPVPVLYQDDVVEVAGLRWRGRLVSATVLRRDPNARDRLDRAPADRDGNWAVATLPATEVGAMLSEPVEALTAARAATYRTRAGSRTVLTVELHDRGTDPRSWAHPAGWALPGVGDEAYCGPGWAVARDGDQVTLVRCWAPLPPHASSWALCALLPARALAATRR